MAASVAPPGNSKTDFASALFDTHSPQATANFNFQTNSQSQPHTTATTTTNKPNTNSSNCPPSATLMVHKRTKPKKPGQRGGGEPAIYTPPDKLVPVQDVIDGMSQLPDPPSTDPSKPHRVALTTVLEEMGERAPPTNTKKRHRHRHRHASQKKDMELVFSDLPSSVSSGDGAPLLAKQNSTGYAQLQSEEYP
ncbi:hypothetical protein Pelo_14409 [Pelomyxa schiedti]|nr:hypothetical protein Pelo_14409 [Pelomyxa schiedti]